MHDNLSKDQQEKIKEFVVAALEYNKTHNIFSRETEEEVYKKDVLDCIPLVEKIKNQNTVLDLGSGGGFPGIILSITKPQNPISLLEGSEKKCYFLKKIKHKLSLENANIINQTINQNNTLGTFDVITARAFASTQKILKLTQKNTHKKTKYLLLKGKEKTINKELKDIDNTRYKYEIIKQDTSYLERNIILIKPNE
tara:strand:+ start:1335 stop:1925 length:591 start_codon:yes stop_codon:yes gene_type:complete